MAIFTFAAIWTVELQAQGIELQLVPGESLLAADVDATAHGFVAKVTQFTCNVTVDRKTGLPVDGRLRFDFRNVTTGNGTRDQEMLTWLEYSKFPHAEVRLVSVKRAPPRIEARCLVRMHGQEYEVIATATMVPTIPAG